MKNFIQSIFCAMELHQNHCGMITKNGWKKRTRVKWLIFHFDLSKLDGIYILAWLDSKMALLRSILRMYVCLLHCSLQALHIGNAVIIVIMQI